MVNEKLGEKELISLLRNAVSDSEYATDGKLSKEREEVVNYYDGELPKPLHSGDSKYVSRDVFEVVDSMRATTLEAFSAHQRIVYFSPEKGETTDAAKQATDYTRHVFFKKNDGKTLLYDSVTDGLTKRFSVAKVYHETSTEEQDYEFEGLTHPELAAMVMKHDNYEFSETDVSETGLLSGTFTVTQKNSCIRVELIQPEDFLIASGAKTLQSAKHIVHRVTTTKSDMLKEGYDAKKVKEVKFSDSSSWQSDLERYHRFEDLDGLDDRTTTVDDSSRDVTLHEVYTRVDLDGSGRNRLYKFVLADNILIDQEEITRIPFVAFVPLPIPHTFAGENYAKQTIPVQNARTVLIRQIINHALITNNPRQQVKNGTLKNAKELTENRLGGIVNVKTLDGIAPIPQANLNPFVFNLIGLIDEDKEETSGISKLSQGMNKDAISTQNAEGMVEQLISQSQQRQKIIVRQFGNFIQALYLLIYQTAVDNINEDEYIDTLGEYVPVNPSEWSDRTAATVELTLGYGESLKEGQKWTEVDQYFSADPMLKAAYSPAQRYEVLTRAMKHRGVDDIESVLTPFDQVEPPEPSQAEQLQMEQLATQVEYQKAQAHAMIAKSKSDQMKAQADLLRAQTDAHVKGLSQKLDEDKFAHERVMDVTEFEYAKTVADQKSSFAVND